MKNIFLLFAFICCIAMNATNPPAKITLLEGTVYDSDNEPAIGVTISLENPDLGSTYTDNDGTFRLEVDKDILKNEKIVVTLKYLGHCPQKIQLDPKNKFPMKIDFFLKFDEIQANKIITMGSNRLNRNNLMKNKFPKTYSTPGDTLNISKLNTPQWGGNLLYKIDPKNGPRNSISEKPNPKYIPCE